MTVLLSARESLRRCLARVRTLPLHREQTRDDPQPVERDRDRPFGIGHPFGLGRRFLNQVGPNAYDYCGPAEVMIVLAAADQFPPVTTVGAVKLMFVPLLLVFALSV